jgi:hypothetical protein
MTLRRNAAWDFPAIGGSAAASLSHRRLHDRFLAGDEISLLLHRLALCSLHDLAENKVTSANNRLVRFRSFSQRNVYLPADLQARGAHWCRESMPVRSRLFVRSPDFFQATLVFDNQTTSDDDRALWTRKNGKQWRAKPWRAAQCPSLGEQEGLWPTV